MKADERVNDHMMRLLKALAVILAAFCVVPGIDVIWRYAGQGADGRASPAGLDTRALAFSGDPVAALEALDRSIDADRVAVPDEFSSEVGLLPDAHDVRSNEDGSVVGCVVEMPEEAAFRLLADHMERKGWSAVPLGVENGATFMKGEGCCTWVLATCTQVGNETSIVYRSVPS